jgi:hypothetical protein
MPPEIDRVIWPVGAGAPPALDRLVERSLQDPTNAISRRFAGRIERLQAPRALDGARDQELGVQPQAARSTQPASGRSPRGLWCWS